MCRRRNACLGEEIIFTHADLGGDCPWQIVKLSKSPFGAPLIPLQKFAAEVPIFEGWDDFAPYRASHHKHVYNTYRGEYRRHHQIPQAENMTITILPFASNDSHGRVWSDADIVPFDEFCRRLAVDTSPPPPEASSPLFAPPPSCRRLCSMAEGGKKKTHCWRIPRVLCQVSVGLGPP